MGEDPADTSIRLDADGGSLRVREGTGGVQPLGDDDKAGIEKTIDDEILKRERVTFRSTEVRAGVDGGYRVRGDLTLLGTTRPIGFDLAVADGGALSAVAVVKQSDWGMTPCSTLFGALKVADEVQVEIAAASRRAEPGLGEEGPARRPAGQPPVNPASSVSGGCSGCR